MVPQPVLAVMLLFPITKESEEADKKGEQHLWQYRSEDCSQLCVKMLFIA
jgi:hypothetical protein